jgi:hypothetical protein
MGKTTEQKASQAILQTEKEDIVIGGKTYKVGKPSVATIIMASEYISQLPAVDKSARGVEIVTEALRVAKDSRVIGKIAAVMILGAKRVSEHRKISRMPAKRRPWWAFWRSDEELIETEEIDALADEILLECDATEINRIVSGRLTELGVGSFFGLTTSLTTANILKPTVNGVGEKTTQSGR